MNRVKLFLASLGFSLAAVGVALDHRPLVWAAIIVLSVAMALRLYLRRRQDHSPPDHSAEPTDPA